MTNNDTKTFIETEKVTLQKNSEPASAGLSPTQFIQQQSQGNGQKESEKK